MTFDMQDSNIGFALLLLFCFSYYYLPLQDYQNDNYCWECHREGVFICCEMCPRVFHLKCAGMDKEPEEDWACSECHAVMQAENTENR